MWFVKDFRRLRRVVRVNRIERVTEITVTHVNYQGDALSIGKRENSIGASSCAYDRRQRGRSRCRVFVYNVDYFRINRVLLFILCSLPSLHFLEWSLIAENE